MICGVEKRFVGRQQRKIILGVRNTRCLMEQQHCIAMARSKVRALREGRWLGQVCSCLLGGFYISSGLHQSLRITPSASETRLVGSICQLELTVEHGGTPERRPRCGPWVGADTGGTSRRDIPQQSRKFEATILSRAKALLFDGAGSYSAASKPCRGEMIGTTACLPPWWLRFWANPDTFL